MSISFSGKAVLAGTVAALTAASFAQPTLEAFKKTSREERPPSKRQPFDPSPFDLDARILAGLQTVESAIDSEAYLVGPGDVFTIYFSGPAFPEPLVIVPVTPEGMLIIPTVGSLPVGGQTLAQARAAVRRACAEKYNAGAVKVAAHLTRVRLVRVHVYGEVESPGSIVASAAERVSACLQRAGGLTEWADDSRLEIRLAGGEIKTLDLTCLYQHGDLRHDPHVQGGEVIYVPRLRLTDDVVFIEGDMLRPGPHRLLANEKLLDFLHRVKALDRRTDFQEVFLIRPQQAPMRLSFFNDGASGNWVMHNGHAKPGNGTSLPASAAAQTLQLQAGDRLVVPELKEYVYVHGAVKNPGSFPFVTGYKAADYLGLAGGTTETADLKAVKVIARASGKSRRGAQQEVQRGDTVMVPASSRAKISQYLTIGSQIATLVIAVRALGFWE